MTAYQYIYVMKGLGQELSRRPRGAEGHPAVVPSRRQDRRAWASTAPASRRCCASWPARSASFPARPGPPRASRSAILPQEPALDPDKDVAGNVMRRAGRDQSAARSLRGGQRPLCRGPQARGDGGADRRAGRVAGKDRPGRRLGPRPHRRDRDGRAALPAGRGLGRERSRAASGAASRCAGCCLQRPDLLLLDEPTNHLDAESVAWLQRFLKDYPGTVVTVTHDRYFLDEVAGWILELDRGHGIPYEGNYSGWLEQKQARLAQEGKPGGGAPAHAGARARMGPAEPARPPGQEQGARLGLRGLGRAEPREGARNGADRAAAGAAARRSRGRGRAGCARASATIC